MVADINSITTSHKLSAHRGWILTRKLWGLDTTPLIILECSGLTTPDTCAGQAHQMQKP